MKKKLNLISLNNEKITDKQKSRIKGGGETDELDLGFLGCCCSGHGMVNSWSGVRKL